MGVLQHIGTHPHTDKMTAENGDFEAIKRTTDHGTQSFQGTDRRGRGLLLVFDVYAVKQLSVLKRLRHAARMFKAAITGNVHVGSGVRVVVIK